MKTPIQIRRIFRRAGALGVSVLVFLTSIVLLNVSSVGNANFVRNITLWAVGWGITSLLILVLCFILARDVIKLWFEYRREKPGSRLKTKVVATLIAFSLFPALSMFLLAFGMINETLREWFSSPSDQLLADSGEIVESYLAQRRQFGFLQAEKLGRQLQTPGRPEQLESFLLDTHFQGLQIVDSEGSLLKTAGSWPNNYPFTASELAQIIAGEPLFGHERVNEPLHERLYFGIPIGPEKALLVYFEDDIAFHALRVSEAAATQQGLKAAVGQVRFQYLSILAFATLAVVFGFVWLGAYLAKRITIPLEALAGGARELASGNLEYRVDVPAVDELGVLVDSFNAMADEIGSSRAKLERANQGLRDSNTRLEERRHYIETILQNIATGVITLDKQFVVLSANDAALMVLDTSQDRIVGRSIAACTDPHFADETRKILARARLHGSYGKEVAFAGGKRQLHVVAATLSREDRSEVGTEYVVVLDDLSEVIRSEKFAAWREVARRLAHEIKNPLTPIQLSAERIKRRLEIFEPKLLDTRDWMELRKVSDESIGLIVNEARILKNLVEEFSRFARLPICRPVPTDLGQLVEQTLIRFDGKLRGIHVESQIDPSLEQLWIDPGQLQRVFVNLIDNSLDALSKVSGDRTVQILGRLSTDRGAVRIDFIDNGLGIQPQNYEHLFLPYFSTKKKGTGLGLAIVHQIIAEHHGFIRAEPNLPRGTRIVIELPTEQVLTQEGSPS